MYEDNAKETPEVENALNRLQQQLTRLEDSIGTLEPRLITVVRQAEPQPGNEDTPGEDYVQLANDLSALSVRVSRANRVIESLLDRIEL